jgi:hypothetical protein
VESGKITQSEALELFEVSRSTLRKARKAGQVTAEQEPDGRKAWLYNLEDLEVLYQRRGSDPVTNPVSDPVTAEPDPVTNPVTVEPDRVTLLPGSTADPELIEAEIRLEYTERDLNQRTAERDRARSDLEHERAERERLEREATQLRAELDAARTIASDRAETIGELKAQTAEQAEKLDEYAQNLTRRYRRAVRRAGKAATASDSSDE